MKIKKHHVKKGWNGFLVFIGFWLSPLSPWNDLFTNIPMAYAFGFIFSIFYEPLFLPAVVVGYWLSNIAGFILMHYGYLGLKEDKFSFKDHWKKYVFFTTLYTVIVVLLIHFEILPSAQDVVSWFK